MFKLFQEKFKFLQENQFLLMFHENGSSPKAERISCLD